jgi:hypothetical protein
LLGLAVESMTPLEALQTLADLREQARHRRTSGEPQTTKRVQ